MSSVNLVIFDMDGVIVDSEPLSCEALRQTIIHEFNVDIGSEFQSIIGKSIRDTLQYYSNIYGWDLEKIDVASFSHKKNELYMQLAKTKLKPMPFLSDLLEYLDMTKIPYAIGSSGSMKKIAFTLNEIGMFQKFSGRFFSAELVGKGKPEPDLFLLIAQKFGTDPEDCIVIEDSPLGIVAAKRAQMNAIGLSSSFNETTLKNAGADWVVDSHKEIIDFLHRLL